MASKLDPRVLSSRGPTRRPEVPSINASVEQRTKSRPDSMAWVVGSLRRLEMPPEEIDAVVGAGDLETVRRYMELHRERLEERLIERQRALVRLERSLTQAIVDRSNGV